MNQLPPNLTLCPYTTLFRSEQPVQPVLKLVDRRSCLRMIRNPDPQHRGIAKPERQSGQEAYLGNVDRVEPPVGIDAVAHRAAGKDAGTDIVPDRIAGKGSER